MTGAIKDFMTPHPHSIGSDLPVKTALKMMRDFGIRHLPVQKSHHIVGVLTDRDIKLISSFPNAMELNVEEVMTPEPYTVTPSEPLDNVIQEMANHKYGCALVQNEDHHLVGILTASDALRVLSQVLHEKG